MDCGNSAVCDGSDCLCERTQPLFFPLFLRINRGDHHQFFAWLTLVGTGIAFERGSQLGMVTVFKLFPKTMQKVVVWLSALLGTALFVLVDFIMIQTIYSEITLFQSTSPALGIPVVTYYIGVPLLSVFVFIGIYRGAVHQLHSIEQKGI